MGCTWMGMLNGAKGLHGESFYLELFCNKSRAFRVNSWKKREVDRVVRSSESDLAGSPSAEDETIHAQGRYQETTSMHTAL